MNERTKSLKLFIEKKEELERITKEYNDARVAAQMQCEHQEIVEGNYREWNFGADPPFRVCTSCGYAEEGWFYSMLKRDKDDVILLKRERAREYVKGRIIPKNVHIKVFVGKKKLEEIL